MNKKFNNAKIFLVLIVVSVILSACANSAVAPVSTPDNQNQTVHINQSNGTSSNQSAAIDDKRTAPHKRLESLVGDWSVEKSNFFVSGATAEKPLVSKDLICKRELIGEVGNMYIKDVTTGTFGGAYYRLGILGYSPVDNRYEWNTVDNFNPMMMTYKGEKDSARPDGDISIGGEFTDAGIFEDKSTKGKTIKQRTVIKIESPDRNVMEIYFTLPGQAEFLADRSIYTRRK